MDKVVVLMSTYNGEKFVEEQIESILAQEGVDLELLVRDDGSKDRTIEILQFYKDKYSNFDYFKGDNVGPAQSFINLLLVAKDADYYAFADQDDVWDPMKVLEAIKCLKTKNNSKPLMYYSNLRIVDKDLNFFRYSHENPHIIANKYEALIDNKATGCTIVFNNIAADLIKKHPPKRCIMHDAWMFLVCNFFGETIYDTNAYISYRQHGNNVIGTYLRKKKLGDYIKKIKRLFDKNNQPRFFNAVEFYECYKDLLDSESLEEVQKIVYYKTSIKNRLRLLFDKKIKAHPFSLNLRYKILIIFGVI